jgi:hypothetical protein
VYECTPVLRGVINGKAGKAADFPKFSDTLTLSQPKWADYAHPLALLAYKKSLNFPLDYYNSKKFTYLVLLT